MRWLLVAGVIIVALLVIAAVIMLIGSRLPTAHVASRTAAVPAPPEAVWQAITAVDRFATWRSDVSGIEHVPARAGKKTWIEKGSNGRITYTVDREERPQLLVVRIADPDLPFGGSWTYEIAPDSGGSAVRMTENGEIYNPLFRFMARYVFGYEKTMDTYLASLEKKFKPKTHKT